MGKFFGNLGLVLIVGVALAVLIAGLPDSGLPPADRRPAERRPPMAARLLRNHLDRPALLFQLRADPDDADGSGRAEAGRHQIYRAERALLFPLGRGVHGADRPVLAWSYGELIEALTLQPAARLIGIGMWLALIMAFNVWVIIWPNQKKVLGLVPADDAAKARRREARA